MGQCVTYRLNNSTASKTTYFSLEQVEELRKSWEICCKNRKIGENIMLSMIKNQPEYGKHFGIDPSMKDDEIINSNTFIVQTHRLEGFWESVLMWLTYINQDNITQLCHRVGRIHFHRGVNFSTETWAYMEMVVLREIMTACMDSGKFNEEEIKRLVEKWKILLNLVMVEMKEGFLKEVLNNFSLGDGTSPRVSPSPTQKTSGKQSSRPSLGSPFLTVHPEPWYRSEMAITQAEAVAIRLSWERAIKEKDVALKLLINMVTSKPEYGRFFGIEAERDPETIYQEPMIKVQAQRIHGFLDTIVHLYDNGTEEKLKMTCRRVGIVHFRKGVNFTADIWLAFKRIIIEQVAGNNNPIMSPRTPYRRSRSTQLGDVATIAWHKLMRYIIRQMKEGFLEAARSGSPVLFE